LESASSSSCFSRGDRIGAGISLPGTPQVNAKAIEHTTERLFSISWAYACASPLAAARNTVASLIVLTLRVPCRLLTPQFLQR